MELRVSHGNVTLVYTDDAEVQEVLQALGYAGDVDFVEQAGAEEEKKRYPLQLVSPRQEFDPVGRIGTSENMRVLRSPPNPVGKHDTIESSDSSGPLCEECRKPIAPLDEAAAIELYGRQVCVACGKELE